MSDQHLPIRGFNESTYLAMNPDVKKAVLDGSVASGWQHFLSNGFREDRTGVPRELADEIKHLFDTDTTASLPPAALRKRVHGAEDPSSFMAIGRIISFDLIRAIDSTFHLASGDRVLDFGCGCGRVIHHFQRLFKGSVLYGTDIDPEAISWCRHALGGIGEFSSNDENPPLQFEDEFFDFVYSISVFTHLPEQMQFAWLEELRRVTKPNGYLILTAHGEELFGSFPYATREKFLEEGFYYHVGSVTEGLPDFYQTSYHTEDYIRRLWGRSFEIVKIVKRGIANHQDLIVCRKRD